MKVALSPEGFLSSKEKYSEDDFSFTSALSDRSGMDAVLYYGSAGNYRLNRLLTGKSQKFSINLSRTQFFFSKEGDNILLTIHDQTNSDGGGRCLKPGRIYTVKDVKGFQKLLKFANKKWLEGKEFREKEQKKRDVIKFNRLKEKLGVK